MKQNPQYSHVNIPLWPPLEKHLANRGVLTISPAFVRATLRMAWGMHATASSPLPPPTSTATWRPTVTAPLCCWESIASRCVQLAGPRIPDHAHSPRWSTVLVSGIVQCPQEFRKNVTSSRRSANTKGLIMEAPCLSIRPASRRHCCFQMALDVEVRHV